LDMVQEQGYRMRSSNVVNGRTLDSPEDLTHLFTDPLFLY
jgi:hypothetical protein